MNVFQSSYNERLLSWRQLRESTLHLPITDACVEIDRWWQQAPIVTRHLHQTDANNWPDPWTLLSENIYSSLTRAVGMCYTLLLRGEQGFELVLASDNQCEEHYLVLVNNRQIILNYWPNTVLSNNIRDFTIKSLISITSLQNKIK
jgi:hypothetical protein